VGAFDDGAVNTQRPGDVFEALLAEIGKLGLDLAAHLPKSVIGNADAAGLGNAFEPCRDVDAVTEDVVALDQYIAEMDADAPFHAAFAGNPRVAFRRQLLQRQGAFDGANHRAELDQHPVAGGLDDPPAMLGDERISGGAMLTQCLRRARFVEPHQAAVAHHIGGKDRGKTAGGGHDRPGTRFFAPRLIQNRRSFPTPSSRWILDADNEDLADGSQGLVDLLDLGAVAQIQQPIDLRPVPAEAAPELGLADAGLAHGLIEADLGNGQRGQDRRFPSAQRRGGRDALVPHHPRGQGFRNCIAGALQRIVLVLAEGGHFGQVGQVTSRVWLSSGSMTSG